MLQKTPTTYKVVGVIIISMELYISYSMHFVMKWYECGSTET